MNDIEEAFDRLRGLVGDQDPDQMIGLVHPGAPVSKARARWHQKSRRFYTPGHSAEAQEALAWRFRDLLQSKPPFLGPVAIVAIFYRPNFQRIDIDNLMKLVMDAATKAGVWRDDCQVAAQAALMEMDKVNPRTVVALCPYLSTLDRTPLEFTCQRCGKTYERPAWYKAKNDRQGRSMFCSLACARPIPRGVARCPRCGEDFQRQTSGQRYCSKKCAAEERWKRRPADQQRPPAVCEKCGKPVSRREYKQCRACRGYGRPAKPAQEGGTV